jgi:hypothetical protein
MSQKVHGHGTFDAGGIGGRFKSIKINEPHQLTQGMTPIKRLEGKKNEKADGESDQEYLDGPAWRIKETPNAQCS